MVGGWEVVKVVLIVVVRVVVTIKYVIVTYLNKLKSKCFINAT